MVAGYYGYKNWGPNTTDQMDNLGVSSSRSQCDDFADRCFLNNASRSASLCADFINNCTDSNALANVPDCLDIRNRTNFDGCVDGDIDDCFELNNNMCLTYGSNARN